MNRTLLDLYLWKKGLSPFQKKEFNEGGLDRIYEMLVRMEEEK